MTISKRKIVGAVRHRLMLLVDDLRAPDRMKIQHALAFAEETHAEQYRRAATVSPKRGLPYIVHPMRVALIILEELEVKDTVAIVSALLHDVVEAKRKKITIADIERVYGRPVAMMVSILTTPPIDKEADREERASKMAIYYQRLRQASVSSKLVKLADRLDSVREAPEWLDEDARERYLRETREVYLPIAEETDEYLLDELEVACQKLGKTVDID